MIVIAEIGNCHWGSVERLVEMAKVAKSSGADLVKSQVVLPDFIGKNCSMPKSFYEKCLIGERELVETVAYLSEVHSIDLFFSIFPFSEYPALKNHQKYKKYSASQYLSVPAGEDSEEIFISTNDRPNLRPFVKSKMLYASGYLKSPDFNFIKKMTDQYGDAGYSDHNIGTDFCEEAVIGHGAKFIEKHFVLGHNEYTHGSIFRDTIHGSTPQEFYQMCKRIK